MDDVQVSKVNETNATDIGDGWEDWEPGWIFYGFSVLAAAIVITNGILLATIVMTKSLHTTPNLFIAVLAACDFGLGVIGIPLILVAELVENPQICMAILSSYHLQVILPIAVFTLMSVDRCLFVTRPLQYPRLVTKHRAILALSIVGTGSFIWAFLPLFGWNTLAYRDEDSIVCMNEDLVPLAYQATTIALLLLNYCVQITCFSCISYAACKQRARIEQRQSVPTRQSHHHSKNGRVTIILAIMVIMAATGWLPMLIVHATLRDRSRPDLETEYTDAEYISIECLVLLGLSTSLINPLVYGFGTPAVRHATAQLFKKRTPRNRETVQNVSSPPHEDTTVSRC